MKVAVVDEYVVVRWGVERLLARVPGVLIVDSADSVDGLGAGTFYDVLLLGVHFGTALGTLAKVQTLSARSGLILVCDSTALASVLVLLDARASGYLALDANEQMLREAVRTVATGGLYVTPQIRDMLRQAIGTPPRPRLSPREEEVLRYIALGHTHVQVARRLGISVGTVETYLLRLRRKLDASGTAELIRLFHQARLWRLLRTEPKSKG